MANIRLRFALVVVVLSQALTRAQSPAERTATANYLNSLMTPNGGYIAMTPPPNVRMQPTLRATVGALRGIRYIGGEPRNLDASIRFIASCHDSKSGGFADTPGGEPSVHATSVGLMGVIELKMPVERYRDGAIRFVNEKSRSFEEIRIAAAMFELLGQRSAKTDEWLAEIDKSKKPDGTYGDARQTGGTAAMILRLGGKLENRDAVLRVMRSAQRDDGGFGPDGKSDLDSSYRIMRAFKMLKEKPAYVDKLRAYIAKCRNADGGYGVEPGKPSNMSATYYAAIITYWLRDLR